MQFGKTTLCFFKCNNLREWIDEKKFQITLVLLLAFDVEFYYFSPFLVHCSTISYSSKVEVFTHIHKRILIWQTYLLADQFLET